MKKYLYDGKIYCDEDLSESIDNYGGDLYDFYHALEGDGKACENKSYTAIETGNYYDFAEDLIEDECKEYEV